MQLSALPGSHYLRMIGVPIEQIPGIWSIISFSIGLIIVLLLLIPDIKNRHFTRGRASRWEAVQWSIIGIFMVFAAQYAAAFIELLLGIEPGSENTEAIVEFAKVVPEFIIVISIIGPILEEIVFRLVIFGVLYKRFNFWFAALFSSLIFAVTHFDFDHLLIYTAMGFVFAFLYAKTKRIIVPIVAHISLNLFVSLINIVFAERIQEIIKQLEQQTSFIIGGF